MKAKNGEHPFGDTGQIISLAVFLVVWVDRWGVWISAMVPMFHPDTHKMLAVLGMDFNAASWKWDVATKTTLPASPAALALLLGFYILVFPLRVAWT